MNEPTFTLTVTGDQLDFMQALLQNSKINTNQLEASLPENNMFDDWLALLAAAVPVQNS